MTLDDIRIEAMALADKFDAVERWASPSDVADLARLVAELAGHIHALSER